MRDDESLRTLMAKVDTGVYFVDLNRKITYWNRAAERLSGYSGARVLGSSCSENLLRHVTADGIELCLHGCPLAGTITTGEVQEAEVYMHHADGNRVPVLVVAAPLVDEHGTCTGAIEIFSDRRERSVLLAEMETLRQEVLSDSLTGLGNRKYLSIVTDARFRALRGGAEGFGLFMADIDNFKQVNDTHGHLVGDRVLKMVAGTLASVVRPLDAAVRWGGEEFVLLCPNVSLESLGEIAERLRIMVERSWIEREDRTRLAVTVSLGAARANLGDTLDTVLQRADERLYEAKRSGRNRCVVGE